MKLLRLLSYATTFLAFAQIVFGAIVRISGSGYGCGDHWPKCYDRWFPPLDRPDLIIEVTHRYIASLLGISVLLLLIVAWKNRHEAYKKISRSIVAPAVIAAILIVVVALLGAVTVKVDLHHNAVIIHKALAILLLATLGILTVRVGGFGSYSLAAPQSSDYLLGITKTLKSAKGAVILSFLVVLLGAFTANVAGANGACQGFPLCREVLTTGGPLHLHLTHRILAYLLFLHLVVMSLVGLKRPLPNLLRKVSFFAAFLILIQVFVAAILVEMQLPAIWRSIHQAVGSLIWLTVVILATLSSVAYRSVSKR